MKAARKQCLLRHKAARDYTRLRGGRLRSLFYQLRGGCAGVALATVLLVTIGLIAGAAGLSVVFLCNWRKLLLPDRQVSGLPHVVGESRRELWRDRLMRAGSPSCEPLPLAQTP